jgi:uncharacterized protein YxeA
MEMQRRLFKALAILLVLAVFVYSGCGLSTQKDANQTGNTRSLVQISDQYGSVDVMSGEYRVHNSSVL